MSKKSKKSEALQVRGKVLSFNTSRKGCIDGVLLENEAGISQVNFRKSESRSLAESMTMTIGNTVQLTVALESGDGLHPVYVIDGEAAQASGEIMRLNYAPRGDLNGYHLDDGTFVHVRSRDAKRVQLTVGARVKAVGPRHAGTGRHRPRSAHARETGCPSSMSSAMRPARGAIRLLCGPSARQLSPPRT